MGLHAYLETLNRLDLEEKFVARALLPAEISEGVEIKYEMFQYSII